MWLLGRTAGGLLGACIMGLRVGGALTTIFSSLAFLQRPAARSRTKAVKLLELLTHRVSPVAKRASQMPSCPSFQPGNQADIKTRMTTKTA